VCAKYIGKLLILVVYWGVVEYVYVLNVVIYGDNVVMEIIMTLLLKLNMLLIIILIK
jgi:hypothetical protein